MSFLNMSAKLIVHKFEEDGNFQTLHITIEQNNNATSEIKFGDWQDGQIEIKKREKDKPRLVVKMVSDEKFGNFNLDFCSQVVDHTDNYFKTILNKNNLLQECQENDLTRDTSIGKYNYSNVFEKYHEILTKQQIMTDMRQTEIPFPTLYPNQYHIDRKIDDEIDPLECCLEKVKKTNALIMENIHILNRTLNYTKKKEILDIINPKPLRPHPCNACGKCFVYETGLRRHYSVQHASLDTHPRWQLVWTCTECFQVWPRQDLAVKHANECCKLNNIDFVQEIKTSSLLQCEFCEKVFTCIPRLLRHAKMHSVKNNYECNACDLAFSCYKTAEQHWLTCSWLKMCYQFLLPKLLLCNACDRKFRSYDQLYNHRYKVGHFIKKISNQNDSTCMPILVYQCEICGQWFNAILHLQTHRSQYHPQFDSGILYNNEISSLTLTS